MTEFASPRDDRQPELREKMPLLPTKYARTVSSQFWLVSYAFYGYRDSGGEGKWYAVAVSADTEEQARKHADWLHGQLQYDCVHISGPFQQEIPA